MTCTVSEIFLGNVGTLVVFRLGIDDAQLVSRELGVFTAGQILNLGVGQAFVRSGTSAGVFNLQTDSTPDVTDHDPTVRVQALTRTRYATPLVEVEAVLASVAVFERQLGNVEKRAKPEVPSEEDLIT